MNSTATATQGSAASSKSRPRRLGWAWFAGADRDVLALVPSERSFLDAQGLVIVAMACVTGFAVAVAGSGWWNVPITHILWLGVIWAALICIVDRLIYKSFGTSRRTNLLLALPRAALSLTLALVLGLPMVQFIFKPSISNQLSRTSAVEQKDARKAALAFYEPKIKQATAQIAAIEAHETALENRISKLTRLAGCENDDPSCSHTHRSGCGHWCHYYTRQAAGARADLERDRPRDVQKIAGLRAKIGDWQRSEATETRTRVDAIARDQDLLARAEALSAIEKDHPEVTRYVLFVLGLFVCLDLVALVMKLSHLLISGAVYEEVAAALREQDRLEAHRLRERTAVLRKRLTAEAGAEADVDEIRIDVDRGRRIAEEVAKRTDGSHSGTIRPPRTRLSTEPSTAG
jgi:Domain of unknown function (DUF4407)